MEMPVTLKAGFIIYLYSVFQVLHLFVWRGLPLPTEASSEPFAIDVQFGAITHMPPSICCLPTSAVFCKHLLASAAELVAGR